MSDFTPRQEQAVHEVERLLAKRRIENAKQLLERNDRLEHAIYTAEAVLSKVIITL